MPIQNWGIVLINLCLFLKIGSDYKSKPDFLTYTLYGRVSLHVKLCCDSGIYFSNFCLALKI